MTRRLGLGSVDANNAREPLERCRSNIRNSDGYHVCGIRFARPNHHGSHQDSHQRNHFGSSSHSVWLANWRHGELFVRLPLRPPVRAASTLNIAATATAAPGMYTLTVTGTAGSQTAKSTFSLTVLAPSFGLAAPSVAMGMQNGQTITAVIAITPQNGFNSTVTLAASGLPAGVTATFSPATLSGLQARHQHHERCGSQNRQGRILQFQCHCHQRIAQPDSSIESGRQCCAFCSMVSTPNAINVAPGGTTTVTLTCPSAASAISMSTFSVPSGLTATLSSSTLAVNGSVKLTVSAASTAVEGSTVMGITATETNGALQEPNIPINVTGTNAALTLAPSTITLSPGNSATVGVSWSTTGFSNANLAVGGRPQGVSVSFGAISGGTGSLTFSADSTAVNGNYTILIQGMSGVLMRSATLNVVIAPPPVCTLASSPASISLMAGVHLQPLQSIAA